MMLRAEVCNPDVWYVLCGNYPGMLRAEVYPDMQAVQLKQYLNHCLLDCNQLYLQYNIKINMASQGKYLL